MTVIGAGTFVVTLYTTTVALNGVAGIFHAEIREIASFSDVFPVLADCDRSESGGIGKSILNLLQLA